MTKTETKTTTTTYHDVQLFHAGSCMECRKKDFEQSEEKKANEQPGKTFLIVCSAILLIGLLMGRILLFSDAALPSIFEVVVAILFLADIPVFLVALVTYLSKKKTYEKYRAGYRAPFVPPDEKTLSMYAAGCLNYKNKMKDGYEYLDIEKVEKMNRLYSF